MIEFKKRKNFKTTFSKSSEVVFIGQTIDEFDFVDHGKPVENVKVRSKWGFDEKEIDIIAENRETGEILLSKIEEIKKVSEENTRIIVKNWDIISYPAIDRIYVRFGNIHQSDEADTTFFVKYDLEVWNYSFDFDEYLIEFSRIDGLGIFAKNIERGNEKIVSIELDCSLEQVADSLLVNVLERQNIILKFHNEAVNRLMENKEFVLATFDFPEEIKIYCKQYLEYFAKFLQDLGVNTSSHLKEEAGKVLFSVTPNDDVEALDKIREALALYLNLPSSPIIYDDSFASIRFQAEVERLQSSQRIAEMEFRVAQKALESQDKIIHQQSVLLEQQAKVIERIADKAVMINSAENKEELEKIYEGIEVGESKFIKEQLGIKFNPAKVVKTIVKNTLGKGEEIIELGLDKKD